MKMGRWLAVALTNCDPSGLSEENFKIYESVDFDFNVIDWSEESSDINDKCDFSHKWDHCVEIERVER